MPKPSATKRSQKRCGWVAPTNAATAATAPKTKAWGTLASSSSRRRFSRRRSARVASRPAAGSRSRAPRILRTPSSSSRSGPSPGSPIRPLPPVRYTPGTAPGSESRPVPSDAPQPAPFDPARLLALLASLGVEARTYSHDPVLTVAEAKVATAHVPGCHCKNLFLEDRKGTRWLVVLPAERALDLRLLAEALGTRRLSFASAEKLREALGLTPGSVSPFGVVNDASGTVRVVLDRDLLDHPALKFHPLVNTMTTVVSPEGLLRFLEQSGHPPLLVDLG
ncbi:MAG: prolyl-tRNA synthetase associated domain-containing protein [Holophagales bacterium]|nr:prolyl-tRNA synthetase associated domain-containing protein [Holophagales bacterium]